MHRHCRADIVRKPRRPSAERLVDGDPDRLERRPAGFPAVRGGFRQRLNPRLQGVDGGIGVTPGIAEHGVVERIDEVRESVDLEQMGAGRHEQPDGELDGGHALDEAQRDQPLEQRPVSLDGGPRSERDERRRQVKTGGACDGDGALEVLRGVAFREALEDRVVDRFDRGDEEQAAGLGQGLDMSGVADDVLDLTVAS